MGSLVWLQTFSGVSTVLSSFVEKGEEMLQLNSLGKLKGVRLNTFWRYSLLTNNFLLYTTVQKISGIDI